MKYTLNRNESKTVNGVKVYRIIYADGSKGGWLESEINLYENGNCRVLDEAVVMGNARIMDNAVVSGNAIVSDSVIVSDYASICCNAMVSEDVLLSGNSHITDDAVVKGRARVTDRCFVGGNVIINGDVLVSEYSVLANECKVSGYVNIIGESVIGEEVVIDGGNEDEPLIIKDCYLAWGSVIKEKGDYISFRKWWGDNSIITWTKSNNLWCTGDMCGTSETFIECEGETFAKLAAFVETL